MFSLKYLHGFNAVAPLTEIHVFSESAESAREILSLYEKTCDILAHRHKLRALILHEEGTRIKVKSRARDVTAL